MSRVLGLGGVFFKSRDPAALGAWYREWLGLPVQDPYGASLRPEEIPAGGWQVWAPFAADTAYFEPASAPFMINLIVDDLEGCLARVAAGGAQVLPRREESDYGRFGWFLDPEGNKVELWQPPAARPQDVDGA
jgi:predicted enzyme related to lactoylglutathione lyase